MNKLISIYAWITAFMFLLTIGVAFATEKVDARFAYTIFVVIALGGSAHAMMKAIGEDEKEKGYAGGYHDGRIEYEGKPKNIHRIEKGDVFQVKCILPSRNRSYFFLALEGADEPEMEATPEWYLLFVGRHHAGPNTIDISLGAKFEVGNYIGLVESEGKEALAVVQKDGSLPPVKKTEENHSA